MYNFRKIGLGALTGLLVASAGAMAAEVVVMDSSFAALPAGDILPEEASVNIPSGEAVTLIMASGETREVIGPYTGPIGDAVTDEETADVLTASRESDTKVLGAVRAPKWEVSE